MIECLKLQIVNKGSLLGFCDLSIPQLGLEIFNIALFQKGPQRWLSFPSKEYEKDGQKKYMPYLRFKKKESMENFSKQVFDVLNPEIQKQLSLQNTG